MRWLPVLTWFGLLAVFSSLGCGADGSSGGGGGGFGGTGGGAGSGGGGTGGIGGTGGSDVRTCNTASNCDDGEPCTDEICNNQTCSYASLPDDTVCLSGTGLSVCLIGVCQSIWPSCMDPGAEDGDFCQPAGNVQRLGRCASGSCEIQPCEISFDCWDGEDGLCTDDVCDELSGECSHPNAPLGTRCGVVVPMECDGEGNCGSPPP
jgi:hypothetical protein